MITRGSDGEGILQSLLGRSWNPSHSVLPSREPLLTFLVIPQFHPTTPILPTLWRGRGRTRVISHALPLPPLLRVGVAWWHNCVTSGQGEARGQYAVTSCKLSHVMEVASPPSHLPPPPSLPLPCLEQPCIASGVFCCSVTRPRLYI